jgi:putative membrane protein
MAFRGLIALACAAALTAACERTAPDTERETGADNTAVTDRDATGTTGDTTAGVDGDARQFAEQAAKHNNAEIQLGKLAGGRAQNPQVKQFAQMMVADHTKSLGDLKQTVSQHDVQLVGELPDESEDLMERLRTLQGREFDREYVDAMVDAHKEMHAMISGRVDDSRREATPSPLETAVNQWASKALPAVQGHLDKAQQLQQTLEGDRNTSD